MNVMTMSTRFAATGAAAALAAAALVGVTSTAANAAPVTNTYTCTTPVGPADVTLNSDAPGIEGFDGFLFAGAAAPAGVLQVNNKFTVDDEFHDTLVNFGIENLAFPDFAGGFGNSSVPVNGVAVTVSGMVDNGDGTWSTDTSDGNSDGVQDEGVGVNGAFEAPSGGDHKVLAPGSFIIRTALGDGTAIDVPCAVQGDPQSYATLTVKKNVSTTVAKATKKKFVKGTAAKVKATVTGAKLKGDKVLLKKGSKTLDSGKLDGKGEAILSTKKLKPGRYELTVVYKATDYNKASKAKGVVVKIVK